MTVVGLIAAGVEIGRDQARQDAVRELTDPRYAADDPNLLERAWQWVSDKLTDLLERAASVTPGGTVGLLLIAAAVVFLLVALWFGGRAALRERAARSDLDPLFGGEAALTAQQHRDLARAASESGDSTTAVREWFRAAVRGMEERGLLDPRPGRTADEAAREIGAILQGVAGDALALARCFDAVTFGTAVATPQDAQLARSWEDRVRTTVPVGAGR